MAQHRITKYFNIKELVSAQVYARYGEFAWNVFDTKLLAWGFTSCKTKYIPVLRMHTKDSARTEFKVDTFYHILNAGGSTAGAGNSLKYTDGTVSWSIWNLWKLDDVVPQDLE